VRPFGDVVEHLNHKDMLFSGLTQQSYCFGRSGWRISAKGRDPSDKNQDVKK
jgi:hypothetical protein